MPWPGALWALTAQADGADEELAGAQELEFLALGQERVDLAVDAEIADRELATLGDELPAQHGCPLDRVGVRDRLQRFDALKRRQLAREYCGHCRATFPARCYPGGDHLRRK